MKQAIYFGEIDLIDTRTGGIITVPLVMYRANQPINEIRGRALQSIARQDRHHYTAVPPDPARTKVIGETT